ncbi:putative membrane protein (partial), partial [Candidatus Ichthyocystis hellenicum]
MFNNIRNLQISSTDENDNESEEQDESSTENGNVSTEGDETPGQISSLERTNVTAVGSSSVSAFCIRALRTSLIISIISTVTGSAARAGDAFLVKVMELYMKYSNMLCLLRGLLSLGERNLISHGVDIRSEVEEAGVSLDDIILGNHNFGRIETIIHNETFYSANATNITEIELRYSSVERIILNACTRIQNITYFNEHSRNQLANTSALIRDSDTSYINCPYNQFGNDVSISEHVNSTTTDRTVLRATVLIIVCTILSLIVMIIMRNPL